jgi:hypothetical protein
LLRGHTAHSSPERLRIQLPSGHLACPEPLINYARTFDELDNIVESTVP